MKGVVLCAGRGTRLQPFSFSLPKTLLPVANRPVLDYCLQKLRDAGILDVCVVLNPGQCDIADYLAKLCSPDVQVIPQQQPLGIADALRRVRSFVGDDPFVVLLGDNLVLEPLDTLMAALPGHAGAILLAPVDHPSDYGLAVLKEGRVARVVEKPAQPVSNLAIVGVYVFTPEIFAAVEEISPSARGEYEITDAIQWLIDHGHAVSSVVTEQPFFDVGTVDRWLEANQYLLRVHLGSSVVVGKNTKLDNVVLRGPVVIGEDCLLKDSVVGPFVSIQDGSAVVGCSVANSICLARSTLQNIRSPIVSSVFGRDSRFELDPALEAELRCIVSDKSCVAPN
ncbi:MAG: NTP transferase domain-containing protein [Alicyclobacillus macrosporangiidus]|uniref:sugar phosphate nucleotidyltransferase n=1 Tax=Alicyclobacillus macrosporangiidus TaxID=392015 RepID=UPI0026ECFC12|nr:sugar phosphate nucleotidyltransferase [Alicyclobacillus macrosporangiidus]MCL6597581.1 NTP transferase domain-containing protein [Alicyclobacillus macrosporangiidus]